MKLTARLALTQLKVNRRRTTWTLVGIILSTAIISGVYNLGFGTGQDFIVRLLGESQRIDIFMTTIISLAIILSIFILSISVVVISNAFRVSAGERMAQFGILKSTGATEKQITQTVVYEGLLLTLISIPAGMLLGFAIQKVGIWVINYFMVQIDPNFLEAYHLRFVLSPLAMVLSVFVSMLTVMFSAWFPAKKAAKVPAINAIKGLGEVTVKNKKVRFSGLKLKWFKTEGLLADKFLTRSGRNFRATVTAITFSVILFVATGALMTQMASAANMWAGTRMAAEVFAEGWRRSELDESGNHVDVLRSRPFTVDEFHQITNHLQNAVAPDETVYGVGVNNDGTGAILATPEMVTPEWTEASNDLWMNSPDPRRVSIVYLVTDAETYGDLARLANVPEGSNILLNVASYQFRNGREVEFIPFNFSGLNLAVEDWDETVNDWVAVLDAILEIHGEVVGEDVPMHLRTQFSHGSLAIVVPESSLYNWTWFTDAEDFEPFFEEVKRLLEPLQEEDVLSFRVIDNREQINAMQTYVQLISVLTYSFVGLLTLIGLTNVISTISENVRTRSKEFTVLQSVGMTREGIKRMLAMEALFCSIKSLLIGLPVGVLVSYGIHQAMSVSFGFPYELPWLPMGISTIGVFLITWLTMNYASNKLKDGNIIETIRSGSGM
ncbi:MAG: ABC transporter permease [Turicibacter sp.]|nr:ABC transporter permease [Turicibacter sp.]